MDDAKIMHHLIYFDWEIEVKIISNMQTQSGDMRKSVFAKSREKEKEIGCV